MSITTLIETIYLFGKFWLKHQIRTRLINQISRMMDLCPQHRNTISKHSFIYSTFSCLSHILTMLAGYFHSAQTFNIRNYMDHNCRQKLHQFENTMLGILTSQILPHASRRVLLLCRILCFEKNVIELKTCLR